MGRSSGVQEQGSAGSSTVAFGLSEVNHPASTLHVSISSLLFTRSSNSHLFTQCITSSSLLSLKEQFLSFMFVSYTLTLAASANPVPSAPQSFTSHSAE